MTPGILWEAWLNSKSAAGKEKLSLQYDDVTEKKCSEEFLWLTAQWNKSNWSKVSKSCPKGTQQIKKALFKKKVTKSLLKVGESEAFKIGPAPFLRLTPNSAQHSGGGGGVGGGAKAGGFPLHQLSIKKYSISPTGAGNQYFHSFQLSQGLNSQWIQPKVQ